MSSSRPSPTCTRRSPPGTRPGARAAPAKPGPGTATVRAHRETVAPDAHIRTRTNTELVRELEVHRVELEMQNEEPRTAQLDLAAAHVRFVDLYDFAPVGYFTLDAKGLVTQANLTGAALLAVARKALIGRGFSRFVVPAQVDKWLRHLQQAWQAGGTRRVALVLRKTSGEVFHGQLDCVPDTSARESASLRVTLHAAAFDGVAVSMAQHASELILTVRCRASTRAIGGAAVAAAVAPPEQLLHDRARTLGARLEISDSPGTGLTIVARLPLHRQDARLALPEQRRQLGERRKGQIR